MMKLIVFIICAGIVLFTEVCNIDKIDNQTDEGNDTTLIDSVPCNPGFKIVIPTFLGNRQRNYYGNRAPDTLNVIWKLRLGSGKTVVSRRVGAVVWAGAGWTGQPLIVEEDSTLYLIQGAYDHHLKKIKADSGGIVWQYEFDDVVKGTGTIWENCNADSVEDMYVILQGSRLGNDNYLDSKLVDSYRAISYITGKELWRMNSVRTRSYSRDVDASALILNDTAYIGLENSYFTVFDPDYRNAEMKDGILQPKIFQQLLLYFSKDASVHGGNLVTEASPSLLRNHIYIASGTGHIWGYNLDTDTLDWDFFIGSDIDGSPVVTYDSCILVSVEKQYISGKGGVYKLDPSKDPDSAVVWYYPTNNKDFASWKGGIIGTACINDQYETDTIAHLAAFSAIDGYLYVVKHDSIEIGKKVVSHDRKKHYPTPKLVFKKYIGPSISTPIMVGDKLIAACYNGLYLFSFNSQLEFSLLDKISGSFEATPVVHDGKIYIASRNGYMYCLGEAK